MTQSVIKSRNNIRVNWVGYTKSKIPKWIGARGPIGESG